MSEIYLPPLTKRNFNSLSEITLSLIDVIRPPERLSICEAASRYRYLNNQGSFVGFWRNTTTPYMVKPTNMLSSPDHEAVVFVGPAQTGKTDSLIINWTLYSIKVDPMDMIIYSPTTAAARDFSMRRIDRLNRHSPEVGRLLRKGRTADNRLDKHYSTGTFLSLSHPSQTELAGKPIPRVALTDYDRMPEDVDGDGSPFDLASKRTTSFGSFAMTLAESSPSRALENPQWIAKTAHEAPPTTGILALYNRGDRQRWYWPCPHCNEYFEGEFHHLQWDDSLPTVLAQAESVYAICPNNGCIIREESKFDMNVSGRWLTDGEAFTVDGEIIGVGARNKIASFWMKGLAAAFASWPKLVSTYLAASQEFEQTGSDEALKKFYNTDLAEIYMPKDGLGDRTPEQLKSRAEYLGDRVVPEGVRFLTASVDVQKNGFVVQVHGISPGVLYDVCVVDRFTILKSKRLDDDGDPAWVKPATYLEDWDELIDLVILKEYPLGDESGRQMMIRYTVCDSGGKAGVTSNAYEFYRRLKSKNLHGRFHLVKGDSKPGQARTRISYPDASKKDKHAAARGDVPVLMLNSNVLKDQLNGRLDCMAVGKGMWRFPDWLPDWWFMELCSEQRTSKGWVNPSHSRNEAFDLAYYTLGLCASRLLSVEKYDWSAPPAWAAEWDKNDMVRAKTEEPRFAVKRKALNFGQFGANMA